MVFCTTLNKSDNKLCKLAQKHNIKYFMISFTDLFGAQRAKLVPAEAISEMQKDGAGFDEKD